MARNELRLRAILLRTQGKTYREINQLLGATIPQGTLSGWLKGVAVPRGYRERVRQLVNSNLANSRIKARQTLDRKQAARIERLRAKNEHLMNLIPDKKDVAKIALAMLYLGEGSKWKSHRRLVLGSSDPLIVLLYIKLLGRCYGITRGQLRCRVSYRADQDINVLEGYWADLTSIPRKNFYKTKPDPRTVGKKTANQGYRGVCVVSCKGTEIQLELEQIWILLNKGL